MSGDLISIEGAIAAGIERVRMPSWNDPFTHIKIEATSDGVVLLLFGIRNLEINGEDPIDFTEVADMVYRRQNRLFVAYTGPLPDSDEYKEACKRSGTYT